MTAAAASVRLDKAAIVAAALDLLDETGLDGLSTRRLAAALGVKGPSLYWHFKTMGDLHDHMAEAVLVAHMPTADDLPGDWRAWLGAGARSLRRAALSRRDGARLLIGSRRTGAGRQLAARANLARLEAAGFPHDRAVTAFLAISRYALGWTLAEQAAGAAAFGAGFEFGLEAMLTGLSPD
jgi:TetR/AcrR family tetracycline transcriptional repressor